MFFSFRHTLKGSSFATSVLRIESDTGKIYINADNELDYDKVNPIFVQVIATDKVGHVASASLTIDLLDVNNKAPSITSVSMNTICQHFFTFFAIHVTTINDYLALHHLLPSPFLCFPLDIRYINLNYY